ncbi:alginate lyase family protein [Streptacidiphilus sp. EB103A]|uniref:alginate lyase family protein n=1 Tax=Streptacidiphilus sp. EB103A TaxID=3156275 RepID=UPI0035123FEE
MSHNTSQQMLKRRSLLQIAGGLATGVGTVALTGGTMALGGGTAAAATGAFAHPGMLHTQSDLERMAAKVKAAAQPWTAGWERLAANSVSQSTWKANPQVTVYRGSGSPENYAAMFYDIHAAYQNALRWKITGDTAHGNAARDILNAWSATMKTLSGSGDRFIAAGIYGYQFANAAELMRGYSGFDLARFKKMMLDIFYPMSSDFLARHNGAFATNYWGSWDLLSVACVLSIGILCDDQAKVDEAITYFKSGAGNGSIKHLIPFIHPGGLGQWVEVGRDQGHATLGVGLAGAICEMAWNQGIDLYGYDDNRLLKGFEYVAKWNLGQDVPFTAWTWNYGAPGVWSGSQTLTAASPDGRGAERPIWEMIYNHYVNRRGLAAPYVSASAAKVRPEGGGGNYGGASGGFDQLGYGTLTFSRARATVSSASPTASTGGSASAGAGAAATAGSTSASSSASASAGSTATGAAAGGNGALAATGASDSVGYAAGAGVLAVAVGGVLALRGRRSRGGAHRGD